MSSYLIVGCGRFGSRAARTLLQKDPHARITVVDQDEERLKEVTCLPVATHVTESRTYLEKILPGGVGTDYIIPALPQHLAFEIILSLLKPLGAKRSGLPALRGLPNPVFGDGGDLYTSFSTFLCPEDCPEPSHRCTVTGEERPVPLFRILRGMKGPFHSRVIWSRQLGPGVGGFQPEAVLKLVEAIKKERGSNRPFLISTACRCHGVTSALSF